MLLALMAITGRWKSNNWIAGWDMLTRGLLRMRSRRLIMLTSSILIEQSVRLLENSWLQAGNDRLMVERSHEVIRRSRNLLTKVECYAQEDLNARLFFRTAGDQSKPISGDRSGSSLKISVYNERDINTFMPRSDTTCRVAG